MEYNIINFSDDLAEKSFKYSECFPVDRFFLEPYINDILKFDEIDFITHNLGRNNNTYTVQLFLCLPELWENIDYEGFKKIANSLNSELAFYTLINFTYKYIEVNIIDLLFTDLNLSRNLKKSVKEYFKNQFVNLVKSDTDYLFFEEGLYGVTLDNWNYIKQRMLIDSRIKPVLKSIAEIKKYFDNI